MPNPHRGLPPPAAMALPPQSAATQSIPPPPHQSQQMPPHGIAAISHQRALSWSSLPAPPSQWQGAEDGMRNWLQARAEEERTRQEEERTRQENLRLEQRRVELDMLRASLHGGVPPPMVPLVFTGLGSTGMTPQAVMEWAQSFMQQQGYSSQGMPPQPPIASPDRQREPPRQHPREQSLHIQPGQYTLNPPGTTVSGGGYVPLQGSPTRPRGLSIPGAGARPGLPGLNPPGGQAAPTVLSSFPAHGQLHGQHPPEPSASIYFHHWQPPGSQGGGGGGGGSNRPGTPPGETSRKRRATGSQPPPNAQSEPRLRSPPRFAQSITASNPAPGRRSHKRQRSDVSWYRQSEIRGRGDDDTQSLHTETPPRTRLDRNLGPPLEREEDESRTHTVSSLLSKDPQDSSGQRSRESPEPASRPSQSVREPAGVDDVSDAKRPT